jgi:hypothetical protein
MKPLPDLPDLQIVPLATLYPHEHQDERRSAPLVESLRASGVLRNPPIVLPVGDRSERFVVLDGANRTTACRLLGLRDILVQVVHAGSASVRVETWNHAVSCVSVEGLVETLQRFPELALVPSDLDRAGFNLSAGASLAYVSLPGERVLEVVAETKPLSWRVSNLNRLVDSYKGICELERTSARNVEGLERVFPEIAGLVVFSRFEAEEIVDVAAAGLLLPAGLTRFVVSPRALRVNYPLERLAGDGPIEAKRRALAGWIRDALHEHRVRFYAEATFLFDE